MNKKDECSLDGVQLLKIIARKNEDEEAAAKAFRLFVEVFESKINKQVDIIANKNGYDEKLLLRPFNVLSIRFGFIPLLT